MDWWAILTTSGAVSAIVGGAVSWFTARHVAGRQERGRSAVEARRLLRQIVDPQLTRVRQYQARAAASVGRGDEETERFHVDDVGFCARVVNATSDLSWWRRRLVIRRLRTLFGQNTVELCQIHGAQAEDAGRSLALVLQRELIASKYPDEGLKQADRGFLDRALRCPPNSPEVAALVRSLDRLGRAR